MRETDAGLEATAQLNLDSERAREIFSAVKANTPLAARWVSSPAAWRSPTRRLLITSVDVAQNNADAITLPAFRQTDRMEIPAAADQPAPIEGGQRLAEAAVAERRVAEETATVAAKSLRESKPIQVATFEVS